MRIADPELFGYLEREAQAAASGRATEDPHEGVQAGVEKHRTGLTGT